MVGVQSTDNETVVCRPLNATHHGFTEHSTESGHDAQITACDTPFRQLELQLPSASILFFLHRDRQAWGADVSLDVFRVILVESRRVSW